MATATRRPRSRAKVRKATRHQPAGGEVRALRQRFGLPQALLARLLDLSLRTVSGSPGSSFAAVVAARRPAWQGGVNNPNQF